MARVAILCTSLDTSYYTTIGAIIHRWATLEYSLQNIIWRAMGLDNKQGRVLTVGMGTRAILGVLRSLPKRWIENDSIKADLKSLVSSVDDAADFRNYIAHGVWTMYPDDAQSAPHLNYMKSGDDRIMPGAEPVTPENLAEFAELVSTLIAHSESILRAIGIDSVPLPDTSL